MARRSGNSFRGKHADILILCRVFGRPLCRVEIVTPQLKKATRIPKAYKWFVEFGRFEGTLTAIAGTRVMSKKIRLKPPQNLAQEHVRTMHSRGPHLSQCAACRKLQILHVLSCCCFVFLFLTNSWWQTSSFFSLFLRSSDLRAEPPV